MRKAATRILFFLLLSYVQFGVFCQDALKINRISASVEFDGSPFETAWEGLDLFPMTMHRPNFGKEPSERSEIMIAYDDEFLWIGARLFMQDATKIVSTSKKRDELSRNSDSFGIILDTYNDNENALAFFTMPSGLRIDYTVSNDGAGAFGPGFGPNNMSWNTFWDVKTSMDDKGWYVEMRIPFSSLRFKPQDNLATMGLIINRTISSNNETCTYPSIDPKYGFSATTKPSLANTVAFEGVKPSRPVYVSPYVIAGYSRDWELDDAETMYIRNDNPDYNAGVDVKFSINSNLTLDVTANTDFAQVEADDQQVNLTRYSMFFPEKRMFFQERSSLFSYNLGGMSDLFYSRNIGMSDGFPIRTYGGARMVGRVGKWDMGMIDMQTEEFDSVNGENFGVFRMRRQVINANSYVGGIFTSRVGMSGDHNFAYGLDGIFRLFGDDYLDIKLAQTYDNEIDNNLAALDPTFISANWERRSERGFAYRLGYSYSGEQFQPGIGFIQRSSMQALTGNVQYGWIPDENSKFFNYMANIRASRFTRLEDGKLESMTIAPGWEMNAKNGYGGEISIEFQQEGVVEDFALTDSICVNEGNYTFTGFMSMIRTPMSKPVSMNIMINGGQFYDGRQLGFLVRPMFNISSSLQLSGSYQYTTIDFPDRERSNKLNIHAASIKTLVMFSTRLSASVLVQYVSTEDDLIANFRLRYNPREGNDFYLVYNEYRGIGNEVFIPARPDFYNRTVLLKYTHTFSL